MTMGIGLVCGDIDLMSFFNIILAVRASRIRLALFRASVTESESFMVPTAHARSLSFSAILLLVLAPKSSY